MTPRLHRADRNSGGIKAQARRKTCPGYLHSPPPSLQYVIVILPMLLIWTSNRWALWIDFVSGVWTCLGGVRSGGGGPRSGCRWKWCALRSPVPLVGRALASVVPDGRRMIRRGWRRTSWWENLASRRCTLATWAHDGAITGPGMEIFTNPCILKNPQG